jgi:UDP-2,3-diacylglucosamine pyrophosphatase LpxH
LAVARALLGRRTVPRIVLLLSVVACTLAMSLPADNLQARELPVQTIHTERPGRTWRWPAAGRDLVRKIARHVRLPRWLSYTLNRRKADMVVVSDLHLGEGRSGGQFSVLEDFTVDRHFVQFVNHLIRRQARARRPLKLVLAGDTMDFVKVVTPPDGTRWPQMEDRDTRPTERIARDKIDRIAEGHPHVFGALRRLIAAGHEVTIIPGNHDVELNFDAVQNRVRSLLGAKGPVKQRRLRFEPWLAVHGSALVEHGQRYEPMTSIPHMLHPFEKDAYGATRLRSSAANYLVAEMLNRIKRQLPNLNFLPSGQQIFLEVARRHPEEAVELARFADRTAQRMGQLDPQQEKELIELHDAVLRRMAASKPLRRAINASRRSMGMPGLSADQLLSTLRRFDRLSAWPHLRQPRPGGGLVGRLWSMLRPEELGKWFNPAEGGSLREGQTFALSHLANIVVTAHTHSANHYKLPREPHPSHLVNSGTWTPVADENHNVNRTELLTFVDVRQMGDRPTVRLRRWDATARRPVTVPPTAIDHRQLLSESPHH